MRFRSLLISVAAAAAFASSSTSLADAVLDWNEVGLGATITAKQLPPDGARTLAMMHVAMFDAANAIEQRYRPYAFKGRADPGTSTDAAIGAAARAVLLELFPDQAQAIEAVYTKLLAAIPEGYAKTSGVALGRRVGMECVAMRAKDGAGAAGLYALKGPPGVYIPTVFPVSAEWAAVKPWFMKSPAQFRPAPPPPLTSAEWSRDLEEIRALGSAQSSKRTAEQTDIARFWAITGAPSWNPIVRSLAQSARLSPMETARLFALVNMAASDAFVAVFDAKYAYEFWRPVTAIRNGGSDRTWLPLISTPMHPEYPCAHCISAAAVATVLEAHFGKATIPAVTMTSPTAPGMKRSWTRISDYVQEVNNARVWSGVHYRNSTRVGEQMGTAIGELAVKNYMTPL